MTDTIKEQLSAFLDGELPEAETTLLLKRLGRDDELKGTLSRYSLIGAALRADGEVSAARHVANRVRAAIAIEPALPPARIAVGRWLRPLGGLGVAAGVAAATLLVMPQWTPGTTAAAPAQVALEAVPVAAPALATLEAPAVDEPLPSYTTPPAPVAGNALGGAQLAAYLVAHSEFTSPLSRRTVIVASPAAQAETPAAPADAAAPAPQVGEDASR
jgi:sigma-E factor negative regulatory protein RseA